MTGPTPERVWACPVCHATVRDIDLSAAHHGPDAPPPVHLHDGRAVTLEPSTPKTDSGR